MLTCLSKMNLSDVADRREFVCLPGMATSTRPEKELADPRTLLFTGTSSTCSLSTPFHPLVRSFSRLTTQVRQTDTHRCWQKMSYAVAECQTMSRLQPHQRLSFDGSSRSLRDGTSRRSSRDCSPRDRNPRDRSPRDRSPQRSPLRSRRAPSPLKHAQFRPLAMEYANSHANSPQPTSCKYYNAGEEEEPAPEGTAGEYCSTFRTVG